LGGNEIAKELHWALTSLSTVGLFIVSLAVTVFALSKFGVLGKIIDGIIEKKRLSTGMNVQILSNIQDAIKRLLHNDEDIKGKITAIEWKVEKNSERIANIETSQFEYKMEKYKENIFNEELLLIDRMAAGIKFMQNGGNSETKTFLLNVLAQKDLAVWNGLCKVLKEHQFWQHKKEEHLSNFQ
jgi:hypothetical protein